MEETEEKTNEEEDRKEYEEEEEIEEDSLLTTQCNTSVTYLPGKRICTLSTIMYSRPVTPLLTNAIITHRGLH